MAGCVLIFILIINSLATVKLKTCSEDSKQFSITGYQRNKLFIPVVTYSDCSVSKIIVNSTYKMQRFIFNSIPNNAESLYITDNEVMEIPPYKSYTRIQWVYFQRNRIENIENLNSFPELFYVNLSHNSIRSVPKLNLTRLYTMDLSFNQILSIEETSFKFARNKLEILILTKNELTKVTICEGEPTVFIDISMNENLPNVSCNNCFCKIIDWFNCNSDISVCETKDGTTDTIYIVVGTILVIFVVIFICGLICMINLRKQRKIADESQKTSIKVKRLNNDESSTAEAITRPTSSSNDNSMQSGSEIFKKPLTRNLDVAGGT